MFFNLYWCFCRCWWVFTCCQANCKCCSPSWNCWGNCILPVCCNTSARPNIIIMQWKLLEQTSLYIQWTVRVLSNSQQSELFTSRTFIFRYLHFSRWPGYKTTHILLCVALPHMQPQVLPLTNQALLEPSSRYNPTRGRSWGKNRTHVYSHIQGCL